MIDGNSLGDVGFKYLGVPYSQMDCQAFIEKCLSDCGIRRDLAGSNAWYREVAKNGVILSPEECVRQLGCVPKGAFLFIHANDGKEPAKYHGDGMGNASHIGLCTIPRGEGAIHSSSSRGCVAESKFKQKSISGGWNEVGLWNQVSYDYGGGSSGYPDHPTWMATVRRGSTGDDVKYVQEILMGLGYDLGASGADGMFGAKTEAAVKEFQKANGLNPDGIVGPLTYSALEQAKPDGHLYTVTIPHVTKFKAEALVQTYAGASMKKEE